MRTLATISIKYTIPATHTHTRTNSLTHIHKQSEKRTNILARTLHRQRPLPRVPQEDRAASEAALSQVPAAATGSSPPRAQREAPLRWNPSATFASPLAGVTCQKVSTLSLLWEEGTKRGALKKARNKKEKGIIETWRRARGECRDNGMKEKERGKKY